MDPKVRELMEVVKNNLSILLPSSQYIKLIKNLTETGIAPEALVTEKSQVRRRLFVFSFAFHGFISKLRRSEVNIYGERAGGEEGTEPFRKITRQT